MLKASEIFFFKEVNELMGENCETIKKEEKKRRTARRKDCENIIKEEK